MDPSGTGANCQHDQPSPADHDCESDPVQHIRKKQLHPKSRSGWRRHVMNFTPSWFAVTMGTGIVSILLHNLPYNARWIYWISIVFFAANIFLFVLFSFISILRYVMFPGLWTAMLRHPVQSLFLGTIPMGLATIVNMIAFVCADWGYHTIMLAWALWWIDIVISLACCMYLPFVILFVHGQKISNMSAAWLLPIIPTIVASASGGIVANILPNPQHALWTLITSYILWGTGVPLAMLVLCVYFIRLTQYHLPPREVIVSVFLPLGPLGQGGFAIMQLGKVAMDVMPQTNSLIPEAGRILYVLGFFTALIMWAFALVWLFFALVSISKHKFPFNMGWWSFTFPIGVFTLSTTLISRELPSLFFKVLATIFSLTVVLLWIVVTVKTIQQTINNTLLFAPCGNKHKEDSSSSNATRDEEA